MKCNSRLLIFGAALAFCCVLVHGQTPQSNREQTHFCAEDTGVKHPVPIPNDVLAILRRDDRVKNELEYAGIAPENLPRSWFSASEIALGTSREKDLIIAAEGPLVGANVNTFWVFIDHGKSYELTLTLPAHDLTVNNTRTNGYRDLEAMGATAVKVTTTSYRFDGRQYTLYSSKTEDIK